MTPPEINLGFMTELERPGLRKEKSMVVKRSCNVRCSVTEEELGVYMGQ